jgi:uncharacterized protein YjbI with pentapeptide repeats
MRKKIIDLYCSFVKWFFGKKKHPAEVFAYVGAFVGGILLLGQLITSNTTNQLTRRGQLDNRFIEANNLLTSDNLSTQISGVYALHQIAKEASKDNAQKGYVAVIKDIFCSVIRENSITNKKDTIYNYKRVSLFQTIINVLLKDKFKYTLQKEDIIDLSGSNLNWCNLSNASAGIGKIDFRRFHSNKINLFDVDLSYADLSHADLSYSHFEGIILINTNFEEADLDHLIIDSAIMLYDINLKNTNLAYLKCRNTKLYKINFEGADMSFADLEGITLCYSNLEKVSLWKANLKNSNLSYTQLKGALLIETHLEGADFSGADLEGVDLSESFIDKRTIFEGTIHKGKTIEEIKKYKPSKWIKKRKIPDELESELFQQKMNSFIKRADSLMNDMFPQRQQQRYDNGQRKGVINDGNWMILYYKNGKIMAEGQCEKNMPQGEWTVYDTIGRTIGIGNYLNGKENGKWIEFDENGNVKREALFENGEKVKESLSLNQDSIYIK